jgi:hypothetical protein
MQNVIDSTLAAGSAFSANVLYSEASPVQGDDLDIIGKVIVPLFVGVIVPMLKNWLASRKKKKS